MPETLAGLACVFIVLGSVLVVASMVPGDRWTYNGRYSSYREFWESGGGMLVLGVGVMMIFMAIGFYRAQQWVQYAAPLAFVALTIYSGLKPETSMQYGWAGALCWAVVSFWYFNRKKSVVRYFSRRPNDETRHTQ